MGAVTASPTGRSLKLRIALHSAVSVPLVCLLIFLPAGTFAYWQGWLFIAVSAVCGSLMSTYFWRKDRRILERRMRVAEKERAQKVIVPLTYLLIVAIVVASALDHRMGWSADIPLLSILGAVIVAVGYFVYFVVLRENRFAGATIEISSDQTVVSTGPYAIVRHPLYVGLLLVAAGMALTLGSYWTLLLLLPLTAMIVWRLLDEENYLTKNLPGYAEYRARIHWRLLPGIF